MPFDVEKEGAFVHHTSNGWVHQLNNFSNFTLRGKIQKILKSFYFIICSDCRYEFKYLIGLNTITQKTNDHFHDYSSLFPLLFICVNLIMILSSYSTIYTKSKKISNFLSLCYCRWKVHIVTLFKMKFISR